MQRRLDRAKRRFAHFQPPLDKTGSTPAEVQSIEDDFSHFIQELKIVRHYFGEWWEAHSGKAKDGNRRMNEWRDKRLTAPDDKDTWDVLGALRDFDVHSEPVTPEYEAHFLKLHSGGHLLLSSGGALLLNSSGHYAKGEKKDGSPMSVKLSTFCPAALRVVEQFIADFDQPF